MGSKKNKWKNRQGIVYSSDENYQYNYRKENTTKTIPANQQNLKVFLERKKGGKLVTIISGFVSSDSNLKDLARQLKAKCGIGGTAKNGEILLQGDFRDKVIGLLEDEGYKVKRTGG